MNIFELALKEDLEPDGDLSTKFFKTQAAQAQIRAKEVGVFACSDIIKKVFLAYLKLYPASSMPEINILAKEGTSFAQSEILVELKGDSHALLICERTILNFLQRASAIATKAKELSELIKDYPCHVLDTRKTSPGMRSIEKEAFKQGGGCNHRHNLSSMAMLKENHLKILDLDLKEAIQKLQLENCNIVVEINKANLDKLELVAKLGVEQIMLDNFLASEISTPLKKIRTINPKIKIEASGGICSQNILDYAKTGVDYVSTAEASRARNVDMSMLVQSFT